MDPMNGIIVEAKKASNLLVKVKFLLNNISNKLIKYNKIHKKGIKIYGSS